MAVSRCRVSYIDPTSIMHGVDVYAQSLYEPSPLPWRNSSDDDINPYTPDSRTEFVVAVYRQPIEHRISLHQVQEWAKPTTSEGPAGMIKRHRVRELLRGKRRPLRLDAAFHLARLP